MHGAGFDFGSTVLGAITASSVQDAAAQANQLFDAGARGALIAPPFYFKGVDDDGLFAWFGRVFELATPAQRLPVSHPFADTGPALASAGGAAAGCLSGVVAGIKDSAGDWPTTERFLAAHGDLHILVGDERLLARGASRRQWSDQRLLEFLRSETAADGRAREDMPRVAALVDLLLGYPVTPAIKGLVAHVTGDAEFLRSAPSARRPAGDSRTQLYCVRATRLTTGQ